VDETANSSIAPSGDSDLVTIDFTATTASDGVSVTVDTLSTAATTMEMQEDAEDAGTQEDVAADADDEAALLEAVAEACASVVAPTEAAEEQQPVAEDDEAIEETVEEAEEDEEAFELATSIGEVACPGPAIDVVVVPNDEVRANEPSTVTPCALPITATTSAVRVAFNSTAVATAGKPKATAQSAPAPPSDADRKRAMSEQIERPMGVTCPKSPYLRVLKRVRSKVRISSTSQQLQKIRAECEQLEKQKKEYHRQYERIHSGTAPVSVPPRSVKSLTIVRWTHDISVKPVFRVLALVPCPCWYC
jgi:hypothetical protein